MRVEKAKRVRELASQIRNAEYNADYDVDSAINIDPLQDDFMIARDELVKAILNEESANASKHGDTVWTMAKTIAVRYDLMELDISPDEWQRLYDANEESHDRLLDLILDKEAN